MGKKSTIDEAPLRSSSDDFSRFENSTIWFDMRTLIKDRIDLLQRNFLVSDSYEEMKSLQGQMKAFTEMLGLPSLLRHYAKQEEEPINENNED